MAPGFLRLSGDLVAGDLLKSSLVGQAVAVFRLDVDFFLVADFQPVELSFQTFDDLSRALDVSERFFADVGIDDIAGIVGERVFDGNDRTFLNCRTRFQCDRLASIRRRWCGRDC